MCNSSPWTTLTLDYSRLIFFFCSKPDLVNRTRSREILVGVFEFRFHIPSKTIPKHGSVANVTWAVCMFLYNLFNLIIGRGLAPNITVRSDATHLVLALSVWLPSLPSKARVIKKSTYLLSSIFYRDLMVRRVFEWYTGRWSLPNWGVKVAPIATELTPSLENLHSLSKKLASLGRIGALSVTF